MKDIRNQILKYALHKKGFRSKLIKNKKFGFVFNSKNIENVITLSHRLNWLNFITHQSHHKVIVYFIDSKHSFNLIKQPEVQIPWKSMNMFIYFCRSKGVHDDEIPKLVHVLIKGFSVIYIDQKEI